MMARMFGMPICGLLRGSGKISGCPAQHRGRSGANRNLVFAAFHTLQHLEGTIVAQRDLVDTLKLVCDAQPLADQLQRDARAARGRFPTAEQQQIRGPSPESLQSRRQRGRGGVRIRESADGSVNGNQFKGDFLRNSHHHLLQLGFGPRQTSQSLLPGTLAARCAAS